MVTTRREASPGLAIGLIMKVAAHIIVNPLSAQPALMGIETRSSPILVGSHLVSLLFERLSESPR